MFARLKQVLLGRPTVTPRKLGEVAPRTLKPAASALSIITSILIILVLTAGSSPSALVKLYLLEVDTSALSVPPKLASSQYLLDLSSVAGTDLTGRPQTPSTLGISTVYRVYVFTCCSPRFCTVPLVGPTFDPMHDLRLSTTSLAGPSHTLEDVLDLYRALSPVLAILLILAFVFSLGAPSVMMLDKRVDSAGWVALVMHALAAGCLFIACVAGQVGMARLCDGLNREFGGVGIKASRGALLAPAWTALPLCLLSTALAFISIGGREAVEESEKKSRATPEGRESPAKLGGMAKDKAGQASQQPRQSWPVWEGSNGFTLRNTLTEETRDGWLRESVLGSVDGSTRYTGDGSRSARSTNGDSDAWYVAHHRHRPVRMPEYRH